MKILVLGIGNVMFSDEGVGVHLCNYINEKYKFNSTEHSLTFMDGGTLAEHLIPIIVEYDYLIVLDCVSADGGEIGDVYFFDFDNMPNCVQWQGSAHEVEMMQTLRLMELAGDRPPTKVVGIVPEVVKFITTFEMTKAVIEGSKLMESTLVKHLSELGFTYEVIQPELGIQEVANRACQGDFE